MSADIIRMAREAGIWQGDRCEFVANTEDVLERFATLVIAEFLKRTGQYVTNDASREAAIASAVAVERKRVMSLTGAEFAKLAVAAERERIALEFDRRAVCADGTPSPGWYEPKEPAEIIRGL